MILLYQVSHEWYIPVLLRLKKDKKIGNNMSVSNPEFHKKLLSNLFLIKEDLDQGNIMFLELE